MTSRRVELHLLAVKLVTPRFVVQPGGRERCRRQQRRNVHAWVQGVLDTDWLALPVEDRSVEGWVAVTYHPYLYDSFVRVDTKEPVAGADAVVIDVDPASPVRGDVGAPSPPVKLIFSRFFAELMGFSRGWGCAER